MRRTRWLLLALAVALACGGCGRLSPQTTRLPLPASPEGTPAPTPAGAITATNAGRLQPLARWGRGIAVQVTCLGGGHVLAVRSTQGVYLYDTASLSELRFWPTTTEVMSLAASPDGRTLISGSEDGTVRLWGVTP